MKTSNVLLGSDRYSSLLEDKSRALLNFTLSRVLFIERIPPHMLLGYYLAFFKVLSGSARTSARNNIFITQALSSFKQLLMDYTSVDLVFVDSTTYS